MKNKILTSLRIFRKDIIFILRDRTVFSYILGFCIVSTVSFSFLAPRGITKDISPTFFWFLLLFSSILATENMTSSEERDMCFEGIALSPADRLFVFVGKFSANLIFIVVCNVFLMTLFSTLLYMKITFPFIVSSFLFCIGCSALGVLFSTLLINTESKNVLLPIIILPLLVPVVISSAKISSGGEILQWFKILLAFDVITLTLCALLFDVEQ